MGTVQVDRDAPVRASAEVVVDAPAGKVWDVLVHLEHWTHWNPEVSRIRVLGDVVPGTVFIWKAGGLRVTSRLQDVETHRRIAWSGRAIGIRAVHVWNLTEEDGRTRVFTEESFNGLLPRLFPRVIQRILVGVLARVSAALKHAVEARDSN